MPHSDSSFPEPTWWNGPDEGVDDGRTIEEDECFQCGDQLTYDVDFACGLCTYCQRDLGDPFEDMHE